MRARAGGVTLIEAIVALVILTSAFAAALQVRAQLLRSTDGVVERQRVARLQESLFRELSAGTLPEEEVVDGALVIEGEHLGERYRIEGRPARVANPVVGEVGYAVPAEVTMIRYTVRIAGEETEFLWHRR